MSKTPRTDVVAFMGSLNAGEVAVSVDFARQLETELAEARADVKDRDNALAAIMAVLPDSAKPYDAPDLIKHFKSQMSAFGSEYIRIERQLKEARAEIERQNEELDIFLAEQQAMNEIIERKNKLIEQMREALRLTADEYSLHVSRYENRNAHDDQCYIVAEQALAAERDE